MKKKRNRYLSYRDRVQIEIYIKEGLSNNEIGRRLKTSPSTITREINRNKGGPKRKSYQADFAHQRAKMRRYGASSVNARKDPKVWDYVESKLKKGWTPELISGRIRLDYPGLSVSHEAIYQYVYRGDIELAGYLPSRRLFRRAKGPRRAQRSMISNRLSINLREETINKREEMGHWESDSLVCSQSKRALNVMVERKARLVQITRLQNHTPQETKQAILSRLSCMPAPIRRSITYDNGIENKDHELVNQELGTQSYFCEPYHSWEKGSVENTNRLIRRYLPKKTDLSTITENQISYIEYQLNNRPKKCLEYRTPQEVFNTFV